LDVFQSKFVFDDIDVSDGVYGVHHVGNGGPFSGEASDLVGGLSDGLKNTNQMQNCRDTTNVLQKLVSKTHAI
jgi:hypothetical protein